MENKDLLLYRLSYLSFKRFHHHIDKVEFYFTYSPIFSTERDRSCLLESFTVLLGWIVQIGQSRAGCPPFGCCFILYYLNMKMV